MSEAQLRNLLYGFEMFAITTILDIEAFVNYFVSVFTPPDKRDISDSQIHRCWAQAFGQIVQLTTNGYGPDTILLRSN